jgi:pimeloyl-ACP methyl ester carboxylesterase
MATATVDGIEIAYDDEGQGGVPLVLVHGHPFDRTMWRPQMAALAGAGQRVIAPDLRGYGESAVVSGTTTLDVFARDIAGLLDQLGVGDFAVCGLSMGGQIAMEMCRLFGPRVRGVVLAATTAQAETDEGKRARNAMAERLLREGMDGYALETLPKMVARHHIAARPAVAAHVLGMMRRAHPRGAAAALRGRAERPDYAGVLAGLDVPAAVVVGDQDAFTARADADRMCSLLRGAELVWLEGVGHMPNLEAEAEFNAALRRLLLRST